MSERHAVKAGLLYCTVVFAAGFVLGVLRRVWITPLAGELVAVAVEAPIMLAISWHVCGWVVERLAVPQQFLDRLIMGGVALAVLLGAEAATAMLVDGRSLPQFFESYAHAAMLLGLLAQLAFAFFPMLQRRAGA